MPGRHLRQMRKQKQASPDGPGNLTATGDAGAIPSMQIPHEAITDPPSGDTTAAMTAGGIPVVRGNSNEQGLTPTGKQQVAKTGAELGQLGGVDQIIPSSAERTMETAQALQATDPKQPPITPEPSLESHAMGQLEGEAKSPGVRRFVQDLVRKNPNFRIPGQGAMSNRQGESFNDFRVRALSGMRGVMQTLAQNPQQTIAVPKHSSVSRLVHGWVAKGTPDDLSVDPNAYLDAPDAKPGEVEKFAPGPDGKWQLTPFDPTKEKALPKGAILLVEHGETPSTVEAHKATGIQSKARAQIIAAIRSGDWRAAKKAAMSASSAGLSDDEISAAIDEALPGAQDAASLPPHVLLPMISAASPIKRQELMPAWQQQARDYPGVSPEGVNALKTHLGRLA